MEELFDKAESYDQMLDEGLSVTGEGKDFYAVGRLAHMQKVLPEGFSPKRILDFGCGVGETTTLISEIYPDAEVLGFDTSEETVQFAQKERGNSKVSFRNIAELNSFLNFDLAYVNGVFHHIPVIERLDSARSIYRSLSGQGRLAYFENNPWNPGTRWVMSRIPFDRDAITLNYRESLSLLQDAGFSVSKKSTRFIFYFPAAVKFLRPLESLLEGIPLGGQYLVMASKQ
jgi:trans-aconitate methyltransferase